MNGFGCLSDPVRVRKEERGKSAALDSGHRIRSHPGKGDESRERDPFSPSLNWKCFALHHKGFAKSHTYTGPAPTLTAPPSPAPAVVLPAAWLPGRSSGSHPLQSPSHGRISGRTELRSLTHG